MPYCPQCNSEYRDGFTSCADCGVPLVDGAPPEPEKEPEETEGPPRWMERTFLVGTKDNIQTEMVIDILNQDGIPAYAQERELGSYLNVYMGYSVYGNDIYVDQGDFDRAVELLEAVPFLHNVQEVGELEDTGETEEERMEENSFLNRRRIKTWVLIALLFGVLGGVALIVVLIQQALGNW